MQQFRRLLLVAATGLAAFATAGTRSACETKCHMGGYSTSCNERIQWVMENKNPSCGESRKAVIEDCPVCAQCSKADACDFQLHDDVLVEYFDKKWHSGRITNINKDGTLEVTLTNFPTIISTTKVRHSSAAVFLQATNTTATGKGSLEPSASKATTPEAATPEATTPEATAAAEASTSETSTPDANMPKTQHTPEVTTPVLTRLETTKPETTTPETNTDEATTPETTALATVAPITVMPTIAAPAAVTPDAFVPVTAAPVVPDTIAPLITAPPKPPPAPVTVAPPVGIIAAKFVQTPNISEATSSSRVVFVGALVGCVSVGLAALVFRKASQREHSSELLTELVE